MTDNSEIKIKATGKGCYKTEAIVNDNIVHSENGNGLDCTYMVNFADQASANNAISRSPVNRQTFRICIVGYGNNNRSDKAEASVTVVKDKKNLTIDEMMKNFENDTSYKTKYLDYVDDDKWYTLKSIGRALVNSNFESAFIAGFIGHITREGNIGLLFGNCGSISTKTIAEIKDIVSANKAFGCCQWKEGRSAKLIEFYDQYHYGNDSDHYSLDEATKAEQYMIDYELKNKYTDPISGNSFNYKFVHSEWNEECIEEGIDLNSERAAYLAGYRILIGYGLSTYRRNESSLVSWIDEANTRGEYAIDAYRIMSGLEIRD